MEASFLFFIAGLVVFAAARITSRFLPKGCLIAILFMSAGTSWICRILGATRLPGLFFPGWMIVVFGVMAGLLLAWVYERRLFLESGLRNFATILLSLVHSGFLLGILWLVAPDSVKSSRPFLPSEGLSLLLLSFLFFFGFAFPEIFFKRKQIRNSLQ